ncbi:hypothetical protein DPMN_012766 [Dreissena polymorpha]|uniref:Uncharacterized protein n=1 Tax=Dreissena polymorpha TaxID=45954 RepID=A0A9D4N653_DREPO|nr:hypothetical protein DPMN_012766 [Dreissena polymorpha]
MNIKFHKVFVCLQDDRIAFWDTEGNFLFDSMQSCMMDHKGDQEPLGIKQMIYDPALNTIAATRYRFENEYSQN